ncbi:MAG: hypothetical protein ABEJ93_01325 [Candidatus Nanohalobium sp.]
METENGSTMPAEKVDELAGIMGEPSLQPELEALSDTDLVEKVDGEYKWSDKRFLDELREVRNYIYEVTDKRESDSPLAAFRNQWNEDWEKELESKGLDILDILQ